MHLRILPFWMALVAVLAGCGTRAESPRATSLQAFQGQALLADPAWKPTGKLSTSRQGHTATRLQDGRVLIVGGSGEEPALASAEVYDPSSNRWAKAASMSTPRLGHTATMLPDGRVLVVGGSGQGQALASAEVYDPSSESWAPAAAMSTPRERHTATLLPDGRVLVAGAGAEV